MYKYKKVTDTPHNLVGIPQVKTGEIIETIDPIESKHFEQVDTDTQPIIATQAPQPNVVTDVTPVAVTPQTNTSAGVN